MSSSRDHTAGLYQMAKLHLFGASSGEGAGSRGEELPRTVQPGLGMP